MIDSHAHLNHGDVFDRDRDEVLRRAREAGVDQILNVATSPGDAEATLRLARSHDGVWAAVGVHPHEAVHATTDALRDLRRLAADPRVIAWGEIGLDYHYMHASREAQRQALETQLRVAAEMDLPVSVHSREADDDTVELLGRFTGPRRGVIHCFTGGRSLARRCLDLGFYLSFSGIVTFRNADLLRQVAREVPDDRLLVETDSPFLAPVPHRGRRNEPARVVDVARLLAEVRGTTVDDLEETVRRNFRALFPRSADGTSSPRGAPGSRQP